MALTRDAILETFRSYGRHHDGFLVGGEFERHLLDAAGKPLPYFGDPSIARLLEAFEAEGWKAKREGEHVIALFRDGGSITLEPGGQFELSGAPHARVRQVHQEAQRFQDDVDRLLAGTGVAQVAVGYTPWAAIGDIGWVPKGRYAVMREHMARSGPLGHHMMKGTAATQASFDFSDEEDCAAKVRLATALAPLLLAMFANSPLTEGRPNGFKSFRGHIWTQTDPARTGMPDAALEFSYERWIDYLLDVPMMFVATGDTWESARGRSFRTWMAEGGARPDEADWDLHLTSVFPEVRVKHQIEVRMADCVPLPLATSFVALLTGLFYCPAAHQRATALAARFQEHGTREARFHAACRLGLEAEVGGRPLVRWAEELVDLARDGLEGCSPVDVGELAPLGRLVERGVCPADLVLEAWRADPSPAALIPLLHPSGPLLP